MPRILLCTASLLQALTGALMLRFGPTVSVLGTLVIVAGLAGLLSQHPRYLAKASLMFTTMGLNVFVAVLGVLMVVPSAIGVLWVGTAQTLALFLVMLGLLVTSGVNMTALMLLPRQPASS